MITLKTLPQATKQEVFEQVATHLLTQKAKSLKNENTVREICMYRNPNGLKCAAGCLIADDEYFGEDFENNRWSHLARNDKVPMVHVELIQHLQSIHDCHEVEEWIEKLIDLGNIFNLDTSFIDNL